MTDFDGRRVFASGSSYAAARAGALAACLLGAHPQWSTKELREAILAHRFIPDPLALRKVSVREETALENTRLTADQCRQILSRGSARGLLVESK